MPLKHHSFIVLLVLLGILCFNLFFALGKVRVESWDEARHGVSAIEMLESSNYIVNTYEFEPDYFNNKPILAFVPQMAGIKLFGKNPFGLRFFNALTIFFLYCAVAWFAYKKEGWQFALLTLAILLTSIRLLTRHAARTGGADAWFIAFFTLAVLLALMESKPYWKYYLASFLAALAFLTKGFHAGPLCLVVLILYFKEYKITSKAVLNGLVCIFSFLAPISIWAYLRYQADGTLFFEQMFFNDLLHRVATEVEGHNGGWYYYFIKIFQNFPVWLGGLAVLIVACICLDKNKGRLGLFKMKNPFAVKLFIAMLIPFILLSISTSKLDWYLYSTYPFVAMLLAAGFIFWGKRLLSLKPGSLFFVKALIVFCFIAQQGVVVNNIIGHIKAKDHVQAEICEIGESKPADQKVYLFVDGKQQHWRQCLVFSAKKYENIFLMPGGEPAFDAFEGTNKVLLKDYKQR